jgi:hypothetical protein
MDSDLIIDFSTTGNLANFNTSGFSFAEPSGRWSVGASSLVVVPGLRYRDNLELCLTVWRAINSPAHLKVDINGISHQETVVSGSIELVVSIKPEAVVEGSDIKLVFTHAPIHGQGLNDIGTADSRLLGVFFQKLTLRQSRKPNAAPAATRSSSIVGHQEGIRITEDMSDFLYAQGDRRLRVFSAAFRSAPAPVIAKSLLPVDLLDEHLRTPQVGDVWAYAIGKAEVWGNGWIRRNGTFLLFPDCFPGYFASGLVANSGEIPAVWTGSLKATKPDRVHIDGPVASVMHPNIVYGHFLLEIMPKLYLLSVIRDWVGEVPVLLSRHAPDWVKFFVATLLGEQGICWYDHRQEFVTAETLVLPAMMQADYSLHPAMNSAVRALLQCSPSRPMPAAGGYPARLYLSRTRMPGPKRIENEEEVEDTMSRLGFTILHPQEMSLPDQIAHYRSARVMAGEFSSALHNALFMNQGTGVVSINFFNAYQSAIARLRQQTIAFVPADDGKFRHWMHTSNLPRHFSVDCGQLATITRQMIAAVSG